MHYYFDMAGGVIRLVQRYEAPGETTRDIIKATFTPMEAMDLSDQLKDMLEKAYTAQGVPS